MQASKTFYASNIMTIGYIGLGKMGHNMVERLVAQRHEVFAFDVSEEARKSAEDAGAKTADSSEALLGMLEEPRLVWLMVPHNIVDDVISEVTLNLSEGDTIIDGGNSYFKDSVRRAQELSGYGIKFLDVGVSGGPAGARDGACLMIGGDEDDYKKLESLFRDLAAQDAYAYMGRHGAGHFVKMVHNGIEYGMMQAIAEGFEVMHESEFNLDLKEISDLYNRRSVVESRLVGWLHNAYEEFGENMEEISGSVAASGEGRWTVETAKELGVPVRAIEDALNFRLASYDNPSYTGRLLSAMRNQFGGHKAK